MFEISIKSFYDISRLFGTNVPNLGMFLRLLVTFYISKLLMLFTYCYYPKELLHYVYNECGVNIVSHDD